MPGQAGCRSRGAPRVEEESQGAAGRGGAEEGAGAAARPGQTRRAGAEGAALSGLSRTSRGRAEPCRAGELRLPGRDPGTPASHPPGASAAQAGRSRGTAPLLPPAAAPGAPAGRGMEPWESSAGVRMEPSGRPALEKTSCLWAPGAVPRLGGPGRL